MTEYLNPRLPEGINNSETHPLRELLWLLGGVLGFLVLGLLALGLAAQWLAPKIPFGYEIGIARPLVASLEAEAPPGDSRIRAWLQGLADRLAAAQGLDAAMPITVHYAEVDTVNAVATLGGHLVVYRGLLERLPNENAVAMIMAHEIAHVRHRDPIVSLGRGVVVGVALAALSGVASDEVTRQVLGKAELLTTLSFSREQERRADIAGLHALAALYGHAAGALDLYRMMLAEPQDSAAPKIEFFATHPDTQRRLLVIETEARAKGWALDVPVTPLPSWLPAVIAEDHSAHNGGDRPGPASPAPAAD